MRQALQAAIVERIRNVLRKRFAKVYEINRRYAVPRITMTPFVQASLLVLRLYLLILVGILVYKFYTLVR